MERFGFNIELWENELFEGGIYKNTLTICDYDFELCLFLYFNVIQCWVFTVRCIHLCADLQKLTD